MGILELQLGASDEQGLRILCLGAHCDDIEIGCGGTLLQLLAARPGSEIHWIVFSSNESRKKEATSSANQFLKDARTKVVSVLGFRDGFFPYHGAQIKEHFEALKRKFNPELILTHHRSDAHQDHRLVNELTWNTFRNHMVLEYEIPKYEGDLGHPNVYVPLNEQIYQEKLSLLRDTFPSQSRKHWYSDDTFLGVMRLRGIECRADSGYAEAFHCPKIVIR